MLYNEIFFFSRESSFTSDKTKENSESTSKSADCDNANTSTSKEGEWNSSDIVYDTTMIDQNSRTRGKLEQLRLVMGERRERRKQRKQKVQPYSIPVSVTAEASASDTVSA